MMVKRMAAGALLLAGWMWAAGCTTAAPGVINNFGNLETQFDATPTKVIAAAKAVFDEMKLTISENKATELDGLIVGTTAQGEAIKLYVNAVSDKVSAAKLSIGTWGDEPMGISILNKVKAKL